LIIKEKKANKNEETAIYELIPPLDLTRRNFYDRVRMVYFTKLKNLKKGSLRNE
jgi:hypothetical protein